MDAGGEQREWLLSLAEEDDMERRRGPEGTLVADFLAAEREARRAYLKMKRSGRKKMVIVRIEEGEADGGDGSVPPGGSADREDDRRER